MGNLIAAIPPALAAAGSWLGGAGAATAAAGTAAAGVTAVAPVGVTAEAGGLATALKVASLTSTVLAGAGAAKSLTMKGPKSPGLPPRAPDLGSILAGRSSAAKSFLGGTASSQPGPSYVTGGKTLLGQ